MCVKPGLFLSACSRELVFPDLGVAGAVSSCSSAAHANGMNHFPSFQSSEIKAYGGRKRRGACFIWIFTIVPLSYVTEPSVEEKEKSQCVCACLWETLSDREWRAVKIQLSQSSSQPSLDCFSCLGSSQAVSVVILSMCMEAHSPERNREGDHTWRAKPQGEYQACVECSARTQAASLHCLSLDLRSADKICPLSSFKVMKCLTLPSPPGYG